MIPLAAALSTFFPAFPLPIAPATFLICALACAVAVRVYYGPAFLLHFGASLLLWTAFVALWANATPGAWDLLDEALARNVPSTIVGSVAGLLLTRRIGLFGARAFDWSRRAHARWARTRRLYCTRLGALLHGVAATVIATGWIITLGLWIGLAMASHGLFLLLLRWPRWRAEFDAVPGFVMFREWGAGDRLDDEG